MKRTGADRKYLPLEDLRAVAWVKIAAALAIAGCAGPPIALRPTPSLLELPAGAALRGIAGDGACIAIARSTPSQTQVELRRGARADRPDNPQVEWRIDLPGMAGPVALTPDQVIVALSGRDMWAVPPGAPIAMRGEPGAAVAAFHAHTGSPAWRLSFDATEWALISALAVEGPDLVVGGTFSGTLRAQDTVVSSGGNSDGFVAKVSRDGALVWLRRLGGNDIDSVSAVAVRSGRIAIAGTVGGDAELAGTPIRSRGNAGRNGDGFVAILDGAGAPTWSQTFGGRYGDTVAGVAIDSKFRVAVAATIRDTVHAAAREIVTHQPRAGLVLWFSPQGRPGPVALIESSAAVDFRSLIAVGDHVVVGGIFTGTMPIGRPAVTASHVGDVFLASVQSTGEISPPWHISGRDREELVALAPAAGGFLAAVAHGGGASIVGAFPMR